MMSSVEYGELCVTIITDSAAVIRHPEVSRDIVWRTKIEQVTRAAAADGPTTAERGENPSAPPLTQESGRLSVPYRAPHPCRSVAAGAGLRLGARQASAAVAVAAPHGTGQRAARGCSAELVARRCGDGGRELVEGSPAETEPRGRNPAA
ncbi:hypothetical protein ABZP36_006696 [Zizania latifolia]